MSRVFWEIRHQVNQFYRVSRWPLDIDIDGRLEAIISVPSLLGDQVSRQSAYNELVKAQSHMPSRTSRTKK